VALTRNLNPPTCGMRSLVLLSTATLASGCSPTPHVDRQQPSVSEIASAPFVWHGRQVQLTGILVWETHNVGLYRSYRDYCRGRPLRRRTAIYVKWQEVSGVTRADNRRMVVVSGIFRNETMTPLPDGTIILSTGAAGPGPLENVRILRWLSSSLAPCSR